MQPSTTPRVALISGASRGIGLAIARELLANGWSISAGTRSPTDAFDGFPSAQVHRARFDAEDPASEDAWIESTMARYGRIDALIHNAGILSKTPVVEATDDEFDRLFAVNVKSPMRLTRKAWPHLIASGAGKVLVMASLAGKRVRAPEGTLYAMSKFAVLALAHGIRHCGDAHQIRCTAICPGFVATDMADGVPAEIKTRLTQPEDIARMARLVLELPPSGSVAEIPISWQVESEY